MNKIYRYLWDVFLMLWALLGLGCDSYAVSDVGQPPQVLTPLLVMIVILAIGQGPGLLLVSPFRVIRIIIIGREGRVCLARAWAMTLWAELWTKFLSHLLPVGLKVENFLSNLLSQRSPCTIAERTQWSMLATSTKGWPFISRMRPWCARCSHLVWVLWQWDGSMV